MRVLILEDDGATRALLVATARDRRHHVQSHADAESVWDALAAGEELEPFDLAVIDVGLPEQDGIEFCRQFRRHPAGRHAIVLVVTSDERTETLETALDAGAHDYVVKPIDRRLFAMRLAIAEQRSEELRAQSARAEVLLHIAGQVNSTLDLNAVLQGICSHLRDAMGVDACGILIHDEAARVLRLEALAGGSEQLRSRITVVPVAPERSSDASDVVVVEPDVTASPIAPLAELAAIGVTSAAFVRVFRKGLYLGALGVAMLGTRREFTPDDLALLRGVADQTALAIRNARLIEERRHSDDRLRNAQKLESLGVLAGGIAHDFNNLLVGVLGNAGLALLELPDDSPARQPIRDIEVSAQRAAELTRQMLAYSGRGRFHVEAVNLSDVVADMSHLLRPGISKHTRLSLRLAREIPRVVADVTQMRQVVMNLLANASDALGGKAGTITIETGVVEADSAMLATMYLNEKLPEGLYVFVEVADTGCGMDEATAARVFEPFFTTKFTGRGLGLAAVLGIVRGHKGTIVVRTAPGKGTTFRVLLPAAARTPVAGGTRTPARSELVLLVDDEDTVRGLARRVLERGGYQVVEAVDGDDALEKLTQHGDQIRAVVLDLTMPGLGGEATLQHIRREHPRVPVIVSSGYVPEEEGRLGGVPFLAKPYRPTELVEAVRMAIGSVGP